MADSNRVTYGDREGVVVRSVKTSDGVELTVHVPDDQDSLEDALPAVDPHALVLDGHGNTSAGLPSGYEGLTEETARQKNDELRKAADKEAARNENKREERLRETAAPAANEGDKPAAPAKPATGTRAADRKAGDTK